MKKIISVIILFGFYLLLGCQSNKVQVDNDIAEIKAIIENYGHALLEEDFVAYTNLFSEDVAWASPNTPVIKSKEEISKKVGALMELFKFELEEITDEIVVRNDIAYAFSDVTGSFIQKSDGHVIPVSNTAIRIFKKEKDGWKISRQIYNSKLPK